MEEGDRYSLGLLLELRALAKEASDTNDALTQRFHDLLRSVSNPNAADIAKELPFKVRQFVAHSEEPLRTISLNGNIELARAAFEAAKRIPKRQVHAAMGKLARRGYGINPLAPFVVGAETA